MSLIAALLAVQQSPSPVPIQRPDDGLRRAHTYSIVAWDSSTGDLSIAVQSKFRQKQSELVF